MSSLSSKPVRAKPQQERSSLRLAAFLNVAAELFSEVGYEGATMTEIAARANSSIGALYSYFPDKQSIAYTLSMRYSEELEACWRPLINRAASMPLNEFTSQFNECMAEFAREHTAYLALVAAPVYFRRDQATRRALRAVIAEAFQTKSPSLTMERAFFIANVTLQITRGMMTLYAEADSETKPAIVLEFEKILTQYLESALSTEASQRFPKHKNASHEIRAGQHAGISSGGSANKH